MSEKIILFDGVCNLCNAAVRFIIKRDPEGKLKFASLQSEVGQSLLKKYHLSQNEFHSIIFVCDDKAFQRSDAALQIARELKSPWPLIFSIGRIMPRAVREWLYRIVAKNRYKLFGRRSECMIPTPELRRRFL